MKSKRTSDGRKLDHAALDVASIAAAYGVNERSVYRSLADFANGGQKALRAKPISRRPAKVNVEEMRWPAQAVHDHTPLQFKFEYGLRLAGYSAAHANRLTRPRGGDPYRVVALGCLWRVGLQQRWQVSASTLRTASRYPGQTPVRDHQPATRPGDDTSASWATGGRNHTQPSWTIPDYRGVKLVTGQAHFLSVSLRRVRGGSWKSAA